MTTQEDHTPIPYEKILNFILTYLLSGLTKHKWLVLCLSLSIISTAQKSRPLPEVEIGVKPLKEKKFGIKKRSPALHLIDGIVNQKSNYEIAQTVKLPPVPTKITSLNIYLQRTGVDSMTFRVHFYKYNGTKPAELAAPVLLFHKEVKEGWLNFDLHNEKIYLQGISVVSVEFVADQKPHEYLDFEVRLGGSTKTFHRYEQNEEWQTCPHHYLMHVTALVSDNWKDEEKDAAATHQIYSQQVKDSFYIFMQTPLHYNSAKKYPVVYLLDANAYFDAVSEHLRLLEWREKTDGVILVGIGYKNPYEMDSLRMRDYTFPKPLGSDSCSYCGGGDLFYSFIEKELMPFINSNYSVDTTKAGLAGHSLGGYFCLYAMAKEIKEKTLLFENYICLSPHLAYSDYSIFKTLQSLSSKKTKRIFIVCGGKEFENRHEKEKYDLLVKTISDESLASFETHFFPKADHMDTAIPGFEKGIEFSLKKK
ncbi:MAG: alpha/beta hydrolase [Bacteroidia bacterium]|nr:alpha/beta hydrolase [Bacteroidia bacterium]